MKKSVLIVALILLAAPMTTEGHVSEREFSTKEVKENSVKEVIDNFIKATGGEAKMKGIRNIEMKMQADIQGMTLDMYSVVDQENQRLLNETEMNGSIVSRTLVKEGEGKVSAMGQEQILTEEQMAEMEGQLYGFRELYLDKLGITVTYDGTAMVDGEEAHKLVFDAGGDGNTTEYYSAATGLKLQTESKVAGTISYKDYKEVDGLMMPMTMVIKNSMMPMALEAKITSIVFNQDLDDSIFN